MSVRQITPQMSDELRRHGRHASRIVVRVDRRIAGVNRPVPLCPPRPPLTEPMCVRHNYNYDATAITARP